MNNIDYELYNLGNVELLSGEILLSAKLAYKTYGSLNSDKSNVIILPTFYTGTHNRNEGFLELISYKSRKAFYYIRKLIW